MSEGKIAAALVCIFVVATTAGTWAAWNSYATLSVSVSGAADDQPGDNELQTSNVSAKGDRLAVVAAPAGVAAAHEPSPAPAAYSLAAISTTAVEPPKPRVEARTPVVAIPPEKPKRAEPKALLDDAQIASLRTRLKMTPTQEEFWPAVEVTLRDVVRAHARKSRKVKSQVAPQIDVNSAEVQQLIAAAVPLITRLSEEQKREVRSLARIIGLETVASRI